MGPILTAAMLEDGVVVDIGGLPVQLRGTAGRPADVLAAFLRVAPRAAGPPVLELSAWAGAPVALSTAPDAHADGVAVWRSGDELVAVHDAGVGVRAGRAGVALTVPPDSAGWEPAFRRLLTIGLGHAVFSHGHLLVHAGAVLVDGRAALLVGETGAGKSTLAWAARRRGLAALSDDLVLVAPRHDSPHVAGVPRPFAVSADLVGDRVPSRLARDPRRRVEDEEVPTPGVHPVGATWLVTADAGRPAGVVAASPRAVVRSVLQASFGLAGPERVSGALRWASAVATLPAVEIVRGGPDGTDVAVRAARLLDGALSAPMSPPA